MALLMAESFDTYLTLTQRWNFFGNAASAISTAAARNGPNGLSLIQNGSEIFQNFAPRPTYIAGVAHQPTFFSTSANIIFFWDASASIPQLILSLSTSGVISLIRNNVTIATASLVVSPLFAWHYYELLGTIDPVNGLAIVRLDGQTVLTFTGNTRGSSNSSASQVYFSTGGNSFIDDIYICDNTGNQFNGFLGNVAIVGQLPVANGTENDFSRGGSTINAQNFQQVNENPPDDNTTYVFSNIVGQQDRYLYPPLSQTSGICYGGMLWPRLQQDDAGVRKFQGVMASQGVIQQSGSDVVAVQGYQDYGIPFAVDPATGLQYTLAGINAAESGIVITG